LSRKRKISETGFWQIRLVLTGVLLAIFLLTFFLGGGISFCQGLSTIKSFSRLPFEIHFIDVGLGDSIFMRFPDNKTMLVDCGPNDENNKVVSYLTGLFTYEKISAIDYLVLTHQDEDHVGMAPEILNSFQVNCVYRPKILSSNEEIKVGNPMGYEVSTTKTYNDVITAVYNEPNCEIHYSERGIKIFASDYSVEFLSPAEDKYSAFNNYSPIMLVTYNSKTFLLTGDAQSVAENEVIRNDALKLKADVLKVGHHGSSTSTSAKFLEYVSPKYAIISVSKDNKFNFPKSDVIARLETVGASIMTTAKLGSIVMSVDAKSEIIFAEEENLVKIDVPVLVVSISMGLIIVWGVKVKKKEKKS